MTLGIRIDSIKPMFQEKHIRSFLGLLCSIGFVLILFSISAEAHLYWGKGLGGSLFLEELHAKTNKNRKRKVKRKSFYEQRPVKIIQRRRAKRLPKIEKYKRNGFIGEASNGNLKVRKQSQMSAKVKKRCSILVAAENRDRTKITRKILAQKSFKKEEEATLRQSRFEVLLSRDPIGTYYYENGHWRKK